MKLFYFGGGFYVIVVYNQTYVMGRATRGIIPRHTVAVVILYNALLLKITVVYKVEMSRLRTTWRRHDNKRGWDVSTSLCFALRKGDMTLYLSSRPKHAMHAKRRDLLLNIHMVGMSPLRSTWHCWSVEVFRVCSLHLISI